MKISIDELWGSGSGLIRRAAPQSRVVAGAAAFAACLVSSGSTWAGTLGALGIVTVWLLLCLPPRGVVRACLALGALLFLPYFLLLPLLPAAPTTAGEGSWGEAVLVPWTILLRGQCGMLVGVATASVLPMSDLREALLRLPIPRIVSAILLQIVHQTSVLIRETAQIRAAMAVRGASSGGAASWRVLFSLPKVWLPRVMTRAERVGAAMELRGYGDGQLALEERAGSRLADLSAVGTSLALLGTAITLRLVGGA